jgi:hypothetical protein
MLDDGHAGPHEFTADDAILVTFRPNDWPGEGVTSIDGSTP